MSARPNSPAAAPHAGLVARFWDALEFLSAVVSAATAVENHHKPALADLRRLGIDPKNLPPRW